MEGMAKASCFQKNENVITSHILKEFHFSGKKKSGYLGYLKHVYSTWKSLTTITIDALSLVGWDLFSGIRNLDSNPGSPAYQLYELRPTMCLVMLFCSF
jgi:hypothetical protein